MLILTIFNFMLFLLFFIGFACLFLVTIVNPVLYEEYSLALRDLPFMIYGFFMFTVLSYKAYEIGEKQAATQEDSEEPKEE